MTAFILWLASFIASPGAGTWLQSSSPSVTPLSTAGICGGCGLNGTRITGLAREVDVIGEIRAVTLASGELVGLR